MNEQKKIIIGCDHAGYEAKLKLIEKLRGEGWDVTDVGCYSTESCDYPIPVHMLCRRIQSGEFALGILICGTGIGVSIAANKHRGIRAAVCSDLFSAEMTRKHNAANVLCMGGRVVGAGLALELVEVFLNTEFEGGRHRRRIDQLKDIENAQK